MDKKKVLILGSTLIVTGLAVYLFLKNKKSKGQSEAKNELIVKTQLEEVKLVEDSKFLSEAQALSKKIEQELIAKSKVKRASSKAGADKAIAIYTEQMAQLGYKPLPNGGVQKI